LSRKPFAARGPGGGVIKETPETKGAPIMRCILLLLAPVVWLAQAAMAEDAGLPQAQIATSLGTITIALDRAHAPATVDNFARYARAGHFDGTVVYRVVPGFVIQAGSIEANGKARGVHEPIALESGNGLSNVRGAVAMARSDEPASATAEFFVDLQDNGAGLDPKPGAAPNTTGYAVFGKVIAGMDVVDKIAATPLAGGTGPFPDAAPKTPVVIEKVTVNEGAAPTQ
jgi:peptidyl-prolyl cis-trans isomerase A (cyclophilin A)